MKLLSRDEFREAVFARDDHECVICGTLAADAHHIIERRLWADGGYYLENAASLCRQHHIEAEMTVVSCEKLRAAARIVSIALPPHFDRSKRYDKWGNVLLANGQCVKGELFWEESVQQILATGGVLGQFTPYVKFPKTVHLPWSEGIDERTDQVLSTEDLRDTFEGQEVVVTEKVDGENTSFYPDHMHARSLTSRRHPSRSWVKNLHARIAHEIPQGWRFCGENMYAEHSIHYRNLPSFFLLFAVYDEKNICLSWDDTVEYSSVVGLSIVPVLYRGPYDEERIKACYTGDSMFSESTQEGYVVRLAGQIRWSCHRLSMAKFVRKGHLQTSRGWMFRQVVPNELRTDPGS